MSEALVLREHDLHRVSVDGRRLLFHVPTTSLFELDPLCDQLIDALRETAPDEAALVARFAPAHGEAEVRAALGELVSLDLLGAPRVAPSPRPQLAAFPLSTVVLNVNTGCNLSCSYCYKDDLAPLGAGERMDFETATAAVELLLRESPGRDRYHVVFFGGEPLSQFALIQRVVEWAEPRIAALGARADFSLTTNATLLTDERIDWLNDHRVGVAVSIDGPQAIHDRHRRTVGGRGSYALVAARVRRLLERYDARPVGARVTLPRGTTEVEAIFDHLWGELGFHEVGFAPVTSGTGDRFALREDEVAEIFAALKRLGARTVETVLAGGTLGFSNLLQLLGDLHEGTRKSLPCGAGYSMVAIDRRGEANLCHRFTGSALPTFGDVERGLDHEALGAFLGRRLAHEGPCNSCRIRNLCAGGCYHESWSRYGDPIHPTLHYCDLMRDWIDFGVAAYARIVAGRPSFFSTHVAPRRGAR